MEPCRLKVDFSSWDIVSRSDEVVRQYDTLREVYTKTELFDFITVNASKESRLLTCSLLRYNQLYDIDYETFGLRKIEKLQIAYFIESRIFGKKRTSSKYFKKSCPVVRSLVYDVFQKCVYILTKNQVDVGFDSHSKKIKSSIQILQNVRFSPNIFMRVVNKHPRIGRYSNRKLPAALSNTLYINYKKLEGELQMHQQFSNNKGIWPLLGSCQYKQPYPEKLILKVTGFMPMPLLDLSTVFERKVKLSFHICFGIARDLIHGLHHLHDHGYVHGNIRQEHVFYTILSDFNVIAGFSDFRDCFHSEIVPLSLRFSEGYYGFPAASPPELFGNKGFKKNLFLIDIWALGYLFYVLFLKEFPPWTEIVCRKESNLSAEVDPATKAAMFDLVVNTIEESRKILMNKEERSCMEEFELLIYDMMRFDPKKRLSTQAVIDRMANIKK